MSPVKGFCFWFLFAVFLPPLLSLADEISLDWLYLFVGLPLSLMACWSLCRDMSPETKRNLKNWAKFTWYYPVIAWIGMTKYPMGKEFWLKWFIAGFCVPILIFFLYTFPQIMSRNMRAWKAEYKSKIGKIQGD